MILVWAKGDSVIHSPSLLAATRASPVKANQHSPLQRPNPPMKVEVELEYRAIPPDEELEIIRDAGRTLTIDQKSVSVRLVEPGKYPLVILEFVMKTQSQYKVVAEISDEVQRWLGELFNDITIRFY